MDEVRVTVGGKTIEDWVRYGIRINMLEAADSFDLSFGPVRREVWDLVAPDEAVEIIMGDDTIMCGFIDERTRSGKANEINITGRCKCGRLVDESMDLQTFDQGNVLTAVEAIVAPWFDKVVVSNENNRSLIQGRRAFKVVATPPPVALSTLSTTRFVLDTATVPLTADLKNVLPGQPQFVLGQVLTSVRQDLGSRGRRIGPKKVDPGDTRWETLEHFLELDRLLAWSSANGKEFIVSLPHYKQSPQFAFFAPAHDSKRAEQGNVIDFEYTDSVAERYSEITVVGSSRGDSRNYAKRVTRNKRSVFNGSGDRGIGRDFKHRKVLIVSDHDVKNKEESFARAVREMSIRDATRASLSVTVRSHRQALRPGATAARFSTDTMCTWEDEALGIFGEYLITGVEYGGGRGNRLTRLTLVPKGTDLSA